MPTTNPPWFPRTLRARLFTAGDLGIITEILRRDPQASRKAISLQVCERLAWRQPNGRLKDRACRVVLLQLHREGVIQLPPARVRWQRRADCAVPRTPAGEPRLPVQALLHELEPITLLQASTNTRSPTREETLWNELIDRYHFLGYRPIVGPQLKFLVASAHTLLGCLGFGAGAWKVRARDEWIGWTAEERRRNLPRVINNGRFLLLPWVRCPHLASHVLGMAARVVPVRWEQRFGVRPLLLETFVQADRHRGTCYRAANWIHLGETAGRGKWDPSKQRALPVKTLLVYPLAKGVPHLLRSGL